jgi:hypothetical protein
MLTHILRNETLERLTVKKQAIDSARDFDRALREKITRLLDAEADNHSEEMEMDDDNRHSHPDMTKDCLASAWRWGTKHIKLDMNPKFVVELAYRIDSHITGYRNCRAKPKDIPMIYTDPYDIPGEMDRMLDDINTSKCHPVENAAYAHLHLARIHPFFDGNGRTSRLLQNLMLEKAGYPPVIIHADEKSEYVTLLNKGQTTYRGRERADKITDGEFKFFNYIAGKVDDSLDTLTRRLARNMLYEVHLELSDKRMVYAVMNAIASHINQNHLAAAVRKKKESVRVIGEISYDALYDVVSRVKGVKSYAIVRKR